ncbi:MAG: PEGA domain-containing protein [Deltaproteobacteria bacterium]|nr:MAG: PEGA domain-containing protein [Deltaproteobacteria bacterium]
MSGKDDGKVPGEFEDAALPRESTEERIAKALEDGPVEVSEKNLSHNFNRQAHEDTSDDSWGGGIIGRMYGSDDPSEEVAAPVEEASPEPVKPIEPAKPAPNFHAVGSTDTNNPIQFIDSPIGGDVGGGSDDSPMDFLADLGAPDEPVPFTDGPAPIGDAGPVDFFADAPQPPTEEVPSAIYDDVSQPSSIPSMSGGVGYEEYPDDPIQEVVIGAPTPPPILREVGNKPADDMPDLRKRLQAQADARAGEVDDDDDDMGLPLLPIFVLAALLMFVAGAGYFIYNLAMGPDADAVVQSAISGDAKPPADLPVVSMPDVLGDGPRAIPDENTPPDPMERLLEVDDTKVEGAATRIEQVSPKKAAPTPNAEKATGLQAMTARITITSNRRAMITLDGTPHGYAPLDIRVAPGQYTITAALPGRAETEQTKQVTVGKGQTQAMGFVF